MKSDRQQYDPWALGLRVGGMSGGEYIVECPFHGDSHPSACFNPTSGLFFCFSCGATANASKLSFHLGGRVVKTTGQSNRKLKRVEWRGIAHAPLAVNHPYLRQRGVSDAQVRRWGIREVPGAVAVPVTDHDGTEVGVILRKIEGQPRYLYFGDKPPLWPLGWLMELEPGTEVVVVEGVFGKLRAERAKVPAVAVMGAMVQTSVANYLRRFKVTVMFDNDFGGYSGAGRLLSLVPSARVIVPGLEADELDVPTWRSIYEEGAMTTRSMSELARLSGDREKFYRQLPLKYGNRSSSRRRP